MPTLILDLFKITLPHHPGGRRHLGINYLVPSTAGDRERINLASLRRQHVASMQSRLPTPPPSSSRDAHAHALGLETWDDGTVELRGFPIEDILVVRMVNKMTGETDTSYELHFEYVFDAERVADVLGLAAGPPVEKDEGPGGWRGWVVTVPKRVHHRSQMWERCMEREQRLGDRDRERERDRDRDLRDRERKRLGDRDRDLRDRERDRERERDMRDRDGGFREVEKRSMIPIPVQPPREGERRSMIPVPVQPPHPEPPRLKVRKSQRF